MGRYEPPKRTVQKAPAKPLASIRVAKQQVKKGIAGLLSTVALSVGAAQAFEYVPRLHLDLLQEARQEYGAIPQIMATETAQGTMPIADGRYIQLAAIKSTNLGQVTDTLGKIGIDPVIETVHGLNRILLPADTESLDIKVRAYQQFYPDARPHMLIKVEGKDNFAKYEPQLPQFASLEDYCRAANGKIENLPFHDLVDREAERAVHDGIVSQFGYDEHKYKIRIFAIMYAESSFKPRAGSPAGAKGLMQLMPATAEWFGGDLERLTDPAENIRLGSAVYQSYLQFSRDTMNLHSETDIRRTTLKAYNAGPGNVRKGRSFKETRDYVRKVEANEQLLLTYFPG